MSGDSDSDNVENIVTVGFSPVFYTTDVNCHQSKSRSKMYEMFDIAIADAPSEIFTHPRFVKAMSIIDSCPEKVTPWDPSPPDKERLSELLQIYDVVKSSGTYNFRKARIPLDSPLNFEAWKMLLAGYKAPFVLDAIQFGFPTGYQESGGDVPLCNPPGKNHPSACNFVSHICDYVDCELARDTLLGPFDESPFDNANFSPIMTRPKKNSDKRRIIVDLSYPPGASLNDGIPSIAISTKSTMAYLCRRP